MSADTDQPLSFKMDRRTGSGQIGNAISQAPWPVVDYREAVTLLSEKGGFRDISFGTDLSAAHEAAIVQMASEAHGLEESPVFVTYYPEHIKFFNMKPDPMDPAVVLSADLLLPIAGESVGAAVREDDPESLAHRLRCSTMLRQLEQDGAHAISDFDAYLRLVASGNLKPHAGYGIGLERILQFALREDDIRKVRPQREWL